MCRRGLKRKGFDLLDPYTQVGAAWRRALQLDASSLCSWQPAALRLSFPC